MAEAHQLAVAGFHLLDETGDLILRSDFGQHAQHFFVGAAVQGAGKGGDGRGGGGIRVGVGAADGAHGAGAAILFVVGVEDEQHIQGVRQHRIGHVFRLQPLPQHVHVILGVAQIRIGRHVGKAQAMPVGVGGQGRHFAD